MTGCNDKVTAAGCARGCVPCRGAACERHGVRRGDVAGEGQRAPGVSGGGFVATASEGVRDVVQETVDAVSGATWGTRNMIMEDLFRQDMDDHGEAMPTYRPPGE